LETIPFSELVSLKNEVFDLNLDLDLCLVRDMAGIKEQRESDCTAKVIAILGNSHASRLGRALENLGLSVISLTDSSWRLTKASVEEAVTKLAELEPTPDIVIIQCLDNNTYFVAGDDGSLALPVKAKYRRSRSRIMLRLRL
jgi:hypothetical protein